MKQEIVAELLEANLITEEEAEILLAGTIYIIETEQNMDDLLYTLHLN